MTHDFKPRDRVRLKQEKPDLFGVVTIIGRSERYAGWSIEFQDGGRGVALDNEIVGLEP